MYTFSSKLKTFSFVLMLLGAIGIGVGFFNAPKNIEEAQKMIEAENHGGHGETTHENASENHEMPAVQKATKHVEEKAHETHTGTLHDTTALAAVIEKEANQPADAKVTTVAAPVEAAHEQHATSSHKTHEADAHAEHEKHLEHQFHQLQNKPWAALYVACLFIMLISLGALAFYAIQQVAQAGWSPVLFRVMQGITAYLPVGSVIFFILLVVLALTVPLHYNHLFIWMDEDVVKADKIIAAKSGYLNVPFWLIRAAIFLIGWNLYRYYSRKNCLAQDESNDNTFYKKNFKLSAAFLVFFIVTESIMSWDWIMSIDPHWFSTLFGWYVFASFFVSGITTIAMVTLYLKSKGYLEYVNTSHIHDLAKFMFGISVFWTYLWFSQFMLIWYANIPEEVTYFITRIEDYNLPFFGMVVMNFVFPILILINTDFKRLTWVLVMAGTIILLGHYVDFFNMIMPSAVGDQWFIGIPEIGSLLFFIGLFLYVVFNALTKSPLLPKRNPFIEESKHFHY